MRKVIIGVFLNLFVVFPQVCAAGQINLGTLLEDMVDRTKIAEFPSPEFLCKQCSSYNRDAVAPGQPGWFSNMDTSFFDGYEDVDGRREWIMMDVDGPGAIVRWWITQQDFRGTVRIYLDGSDTPVYAAKANQLVGGTTITGSPLSKAIGWNGQNLYLPISFRQHCKVTYDGLNTHETGDLGDCMFYQINYTQYPSGTDVKTFTKADLDEHSDLIDEVQTKLLQPGNNKLSVARQVAGGSSVLGCGESITRDIEGTGEISLLKVKIDGNDISQAMRSVVISISFDGKERVLSPVGDFFGCGLGVNPFKGWWRQVQSDGWMKCWWPMPFRRNATVKIINHGNSDVMVELGDIGVANYGWTDQTMYFNGTWRGDNHLDTSKAFDWNYLTVDGKGVYAGDTLSLFNKAVHPHPNGVGTWWGEGDEKVFVDNEAFPSHFGTGTEDYYGYSWGIGGTFQAPFHAMPRGDANGNYTEFGHTTNTRVRSLDRIPFKNHLQFDMEILHWQTIAKLDYGVATYWYAFDGAQGNGQATPEKVRQKIADFTGGVDPNPNPDPGYDAEYIHRNGNVTQLTGTSDGWGPPSHASDGDISNDTGKWFAHYAGTTPPRIVIDLESNYVIDALYLYPYGWAGLTSTQGNTITDMELRFATSAQGAVFTGDPIELNAAGTAWGTPETVEFGTTYTARYVEFTAIGSYDPAGAQAIVDIQFRKAYPVQSHPQSKTVAAGSPAVFNVGGVGITSYQWYRNGSLLAGRTSDTLTINNVQLSDEGFYHCVVDGDLSSNKARLLTERLMARWDFENSLDDEVANVAGTYSGASATYSSDSIEGSKSFSFGSGTNFIEVDIPEYFDFFAHGMTISAWVKVTQTPLELDVYLSKGDLCWLNVETAGWTQVRIGSNSWVWSDETVLQDDGWHMTTVTYEPVEGKFRYYVDGKLASEFEDKPAFSNEPLIFGAADTAGTNRYYGLLDDVQIYSYALDAYAIATAYVAKVPTASICLDQLGLEGDFDGDCDVDIADIAKFAAFWLNCRRIAGTQSDLIDCL